MEFPNLKWCYCFSDFSTTTCSTLEHITVLLSFASAIFRISDGSSLSIEYDDVYCVLCKKHVAEKTHVCQCSDCSP